MRNHALVLSILGLTRSQRPVKLGLLSFEHLLLLLISFLLLYDLPSSTAVDVALWMMTVQLTLRSEASQLYGVSVQACCCVLADWPR